VYTRFPYSFLDEVIPSPYVFSPKLERIEEVKIVTVCQCKLFLAKLDPSFYGFVVVVVIWIRDKSVDEVHLHFDFSIYRNLSSEDSISEDAIILWSCCV
jgi:hypothetical protein